MNRAQYRQHIADITNHPNRGQKGTKRLNRIMQIAMKQLYADLPSAMLQEEYRFQLEPPVDGLTLTADATDRLSFAATGGFLSDPGASDPEVYRGRTLEVLDLNGHYQYFTIRDFSGQPPASLNIIVDKPWNGTADTGLSARIITREYPYPHDVSKIHRVWYSPEKQRAVLMYPLTRDRVDNLNWMNGPRNTGLPQFYGRGNFYQLQAPHYTPAISYISDQPGNNEKWGWNPSTSQEHGVGNGNLPFYGPGGTFSYKVCHVLGRRRWPQALRDTPDAWSREPWYISAPSPATDQIVAKWGGGAIQIDSPDIDYLDGYGPYNTRTSYHHGGVEKWWFRARHDTDPEGLGNNAQFTRAYESDAYYLWAVTDGFTTTVYDHGQNDPVERNWPLKDIYGHQHLRFDRLPSEAEFIKMDISRRPPLLNHDSDVPRVPPEAHMLFVNLLCAYILGRVDGKPDRESMFYKDYLRSIERLREEYGMPAHARPEFGDGLSTFDAVGGRWDNIGEIP